MPAAPRFSSSRALRRSLRPVVGVTSAVAMSIGLVWTAGAATADDVVLAPVVVADQAAVVDLVEPLGSVAAVGLGDFIAASVDVAAVTGARIVEEIESEPACPVVHAEFINSWGFSRSGGRRHKGVDMMASHGTPVYAPADGVMRISNSSLGGLGFYLYAEDGYEYFGSHLQTVIGAGPVTRGQQIGTVGSTGNASASGPHLHFEVMRPGRSSVNPYPYVADWCDGKRADDVGARTDGVDLSVLEGLDPETVDLIADLDPGLLRSVT